MDIHTGGVDLKFPHHDNEIAQAEVLLVYVAVTMTTLHATGIQQRRPVGQLLSSFRTFNY